MSEVDYIPSVGLDAFTFTSYQSEGLEEIWEVLTGEKHRGGEPVTIRGYEGVNQNFNNGQVFWGVGQQKGFTHWLLSGSGELSSRLMLFDHSPACRCTRLDIRLDIAQKPQANIYTISKSSPYNKIVRGGGGKTFYFGSRYSERLVRIYDKTAQMKFVKKIADYPSGIWRYEGETKGDVSDSLKSLVFSDKPISKKISFLHGYLQAMFIQKGLDFPLTTEVKDCKLDLPKKAGAINWLWLGEVIAPYLQRARGEDDAKFADFIAEVLKK